MLTHEQIAALRDRSAQITDPINDYLLEDIARRISEAGQLTSTASYQIWRAQQLGMSQRDIRKRLKELLNKSDSEIKKLLTQSAEVGYRFDLDRLPTAAAIPFEDNAVIQQIVSAAVKLAQDDFTNLTQTLGMVDPYGKALPLQDAYRNCTDYAFKQVITGATDYNTAIRRATRNLAEKGVRVIDYESGVHTSLEAAVRRNIMGGLGLMQEQITQMNHDQLGADGWEISAHANSAPDHEPIQGKQYSDAAYEALNNSLVRRIGTLNCGHAAFPIILGVSSPQYTPEELEKFRADNEKGVTVDGKHYTGYEATQMQRKLERSMRAQKRRILVAEASGDKDTLVIAQTRLQRLREEYSRFSKDAGLRTQQERLEVAGFGPNQASTPAKAEKKNSSKPVLEQLNFADGASDSDIESVESEVAKIPQKAREIAERAISHVVITDDDRSGYSPRTGVIFLNRTRDTGTVAHEYAHAIETALNLYEDSEFLAILRKGFENLSLSDIIEDEDTFSKTIFRIWSKKLVSLYQGRLYERYGIYDGQHVILDGMREYFSEGFRVYVTDPELLEEKDKDLFDYIRRNFS